MDGIIKNKVQFLAEQDGDVERVFKEKIILFLKRRKELFRAYLAQVTYEKNDTDFKVALCFKVGESCIDYDDIISGVTGIFQSLFGGDQSLDLIFLDDPQEAFLREVCCPFYTSYQYQVNQADFYLISSEGYSLEYPVKCYKRKKLKGFDDKDYMLCDIDVPLNGQYYSVDGKEVNQLVFSVRHRGYSLFPISAWPAYVYVEILTVKDVCELFLLKDIDIKLIAWGELYKKLSDIH